jgi:hypothetical protein
VVRSLRPPLTTRAMPYLILFAIVLLFGMLAMCTLM